MEIEEWRRLIARSSENVRVAQENLDTATNHYSSAEEAWATKAATVWRSNKATTKSTNALSLLVEGETIEEKASLRVAVEWLRTARAALDSAVAIHNAALAEGRILNSIIGAGG